MSSKNIWIAALIVVIVLVGGITLWKGGFSWLGGGTSPTSTENEALVGGQEDTGTNKGGTGKLNDDVYIEIMTQSAYNLQENPLIWTESGYKNFLSKYGVTEEDVVAYGEEINNNPQRAQEIAQKYIARLLELQNTIK